MRAALPVVIIVPLLASCVPEAPESGASGPPAPIPNDTCGANNYQALIGQTAPTISVPANAAYRSYRSGDAVTMDLNPNRLNFEHDKSGRLVRVSCG